MKIKITTERRAADVWATARCSKGRVIAERFGPTLAIALQRVQADVVAASETATSRKATRIEWDID